MAPEPPLTAPVVVALRVNRLVASVVSLPLLRSRAAEVLVAVSGPPASVTPAGLMI